MFEFKAEYSGQNHHHHHLKRIVALNILLVPNICYYISVCVSKAGYSGHTSKPPLVWPLLAINNRPTFPHNNDNEDLYYHTMIIYNIIPPLAPTVYQQQLPAYLPTSPQNQNCEGRASLDDQGNQQKQLSNHSVMLVKQICSLYFFFFTTTRCPAERAEGEAETAEQAESH